MEVGNLTEATCPLIRLGVNMSDGNNSFQQSDRSCLAPELASRLMNGDRKHAEYVLADLEQAAFFAMVEPTIMRHDRSRTSMGAVA